MASEHPEIWPPTRWPNAPGFSRRGTLTVVGDVRIEYRTTLPDLDFPEVTENRLVYEQITPIVAGTAVNLARAAIRCFARVNVVGKVGEDAFTPAIVQSVRQAGAEPAFQLATGVPNGITLVIRAGARGTMPGTRLLIAGRPAPNELLDRADIRASAGLLANSDVVACDGYSLLSPAGARALDEVARVVRAAGRMLCLDLVPHDLDRRLDHQLIRAWLEPADMVITEARTLGRLLGVATSSPCPLREARALVSGQTLPGGRRPLWLIRCGPGDMDDTLVYRDGEMCRGYPTGYRGAATKMGFGDALAAAELSWWLFGRGGPGVLGLTHGDSSRPQWDGPADPAAG